INSFADAKRSIDEDELSYLRESFESTLELVQQKFGDKAFKIFDVQGNIESSFNSALYDAQMIATRQLSNEGRLTTKSERAVCDALANAFLTDENFRRSISIATSDESQLRTRVTALRKVLKT